MVHFKSIRGKEKKVLTVMIIVHVFRFIFCDFETCNVIFNQVYYFHVHGPNVLVFGKPICVSQFYTSIFDIIVLFTVFDHMRLGLY